MSILERGRLVARLAEGPGDVAAALALRARCFRNDEQSDRDDFDARCDHVLVEDRCTGDLVCCYRLMAVTGAGIPDTYSAQFYDLGALSGFPVSSLELGRFCIAPGLCDPDILRVAWGAMTRVVDRTGAGMLFGCSSFSGTDADVHSDAFGWLAARHLAPASWRPGIKAPRVIRFADLLQEPDLRRAMAAAPPLLRTYLTMGGCVSDHAVVDAELNTLHVFTGLEIAKVPAARARLLRAVAG